MKSRFRRACFQVHLWAGLIVSLVWIVAALTGAILAFRSELDVLLHPRLLRVVPGASRITADAAVAAVLAARPGDTAKFVRFPAHPAATYEIQVENRIQVFVNPFTGEVLGARDRDRGFLGDVDRLHRFLLAGPIGKVVVDICTVGSVFVLLTGLYLWIPKSTRMLIASLKLNFRLRGRASWLNWHMVVGIYAAVFLVISSVTALPLAYGWVKNSLFTLTGSDPAPKPPDSEASRGRSRISIEAAWQAALRHTPHFREALLRIPVSEHDPMNFYMIAAAEIHAEARSTLFIDAYTGAVLAYTPYREHSAGLKLFYALKSLHLATFGGRAVQLLLVAAMLTVPVLVVTGAWMYYRRKFKSPARTAAHGGTGAGTAPSPKPSAKIISISHE